LTEEPHLTPHVRASAGSLASRVTGSFDRARIGGGALDWLKAGESADEIAKQAEIAFSKLPTILSSRKLSRPADTP
jgi:hypothetical protein